MLNFTSENKVIWILGKIGQFVLLNFLVLLGCIPIVTIGASLSAGARCMKKMKEPEGGILTLEFFHAFAADVKQATGAWLVLAIVMVLGAGDIYYAIRIAEPVNMFFLFFGGVLFFVAVSMLFWIFPLVANYDNRVKGHLTNAFLFAFGKLPATLLLWGIWGSPVILCYFRPVFTSLVGYIIVFFGVALQLWLSHLIWDHTLCREETSSGSAKNSCA